ncbi:fibronectin-binding protein [Mycolicibacterium sp. XJ1819]
MLRRALITATVPLAAALTATVLSAPTAGAQPPGPPPCEFALSFLCNIIPMAPGLDHDIDLTEQAPVDPNAPLPESLPPADPCAAGCI